MAPVPRGMLPRFFGRFPVLLAMVCLLAACGPVAAPQVQTRYLWPPSVEDAKIEYIGFYVGDEDLRRGSENWFERQVLGQRLSHPVFKKPFAVDARFRKVVVTDTLARQVILFDLDRKSISTLEISDESAGKSSAAFGTGTGVAFAGPDEFWLAVSQSQDVVRCQVDGRIVGKVGGAGRLTRPTAVAIDHASRRAVVVDTPMHRLAVFGLDGTFLDYIGERGAGPGQFNYPLDADFDSAGNLFVLDSLNARVQRFQWDGTAYRYVLHFGERGTAAGSFQMPKSLAVTPAGHVYITDSLADKVTVFDRDGTFLLTFGGRYISSKGQISPGGLNMPAGIAADENDGLWIADSLNGMVHRFQYLNEAYLQKHPISPEQLALPGAER
ncbi:MAG: hypothetical protein FDZ69_09040 [Deltaproteobacteria bacterium]|nr:MAG: hypothetical protein FDZ69_09040 [Deltaproteobacteria bacterium]